MRVFVLLFLLYIVLAPQAQAAKRVGFFSIRTQSLTFVSETRISDPEAPVVEEAEEESSSAGILGRLARRLVGQPQTLDLCVLSTRRAVFGIIGFWESRRYVLAPGRCEGEEFYEFEDGMFAEAQAGGVIPEGVPAAPEWTPEDYLKGFWGIGLAVGLFGMSGVTAMRFKRAAKKRSGVLGEADTMGKRAGTVMAAAARADGKASEKELALIRDILNTLTADPLTEDEVREVVRNTPKMTAEQLGELGTGVDLEDRMDLYQAAVLVTMADGEPSGNERHFLGRLAKGLRLNDNEAGTVYARVLNMRETA